MQKKCASQDIFNKYGSGIGRDDALHETVKPFGFEPARTSKKVSTECGAPVRRCDPIRQGYPEGSAVQRIRQTVVQAEETAANWGRESLVRGCLGQWMLR